ncbi:MAG TPA: DinB family protein [Methylomirabilota bacterium]|nr:DinB family protein [Methylomirabilota bacterium]
MTLLESISIDLRRLHEALDKSLAGLTAEQLHTVPARHPKANTIAWNLWHYARTEDNVVRFVLQNRRPTVWTEGGYAAKLGLQALHPAAQGTGMSTEEAQALRIPDPALFAEYMTKVWASTDEFLPTLTPAALERIVPMKFVGDMPLVRVLAFVGVTHGFTHFGEVELTRTLVGAAPVYGA